jgi:hypothetical protein
VEAAIEKDIESSQPALERIPYRRVRMFVERAFVVHQTRKGKRRAASTANASPANASPANASAVSANVAAAREG